MFCDVYLNTPAFLRREGRRKRKAGAKNEKAIIIITAVWAGSSKISINTQRKCFLEKILW
jgi:hypothetical protein